MTFHSPFLKLSGRTLALFLLLFCGSVQAQNIILHLRNGDRIAGTILSENTNQVTLATVWAKEIVIPLAQIERREVPPAVVTSVLPTNSVPPPPIAIIPAEPPKPAPSPAKTNSWWSLWKGEAAVGMDLERGATDHELYYGKVKLTYAQPYASDPKEFFRNILNYDVAYGKTDGTRSDDRMGGSSKTDFDVSRHIYVYNLGSAYYDKVRLIDLHYEDGPGVGYHWITRSNFVVNLELGANYQVEERSDSTRTESFYYRAGEDVTWKINKQMNLTEKAEFFDRSDSASQYRFRFESTLSYALLLNLSLNLSVIDFYDTQPAATVPNNDLQVRTTLGLKF